MTSRAGARGAGRELARPRAWTPHPTHPPDPPLCAALCSLPLCFCRGPGRGGGAARRGGGRLPCAAPAPPGLTPTPRHRSASRGCRRACTGWGAAAGAGALRVLCCFPACLYPALPACPSRIPSVSELAHRWQSIQGMHRNDGIKAVHGNASSLYIHALVLHNVLDQMLMNSFWTQ